MRSPSLLRGQGRAGERALRIHLLSIKKLEENVGGFQIATVKGIPIRIHYTFLLILPFLAYQFGLVFRAAAKHADVPLDQLQGNPFVWGLILALAPFFSVVVHELAHSLYALRKGGRVRDITLLMIGGVSNLSEPPKSPRGEAVMALVGPLISVALGVVFYAVDRVVSRLGSFELKFGFFYLAEMGRTVLCQSLLSSCCSLLTSSRIDAT
jgi:Zn-dependent protease